MQRGKPGSDRAQARTSGGWIEDLLAGLPVPTFVIDADHRITHWNRACELVLGQAASRMIGTRDQWLPFYPHPRPVMADLVVSGELDTGIDTYYRDKYRRSSLVPGSYEAEDFFPALGAGGKWLYFTAAPLRDAAGRVVGAIETLQDVSARHLADAALKLEHSIQNSIIEHFPSGVAVFDAKLDIVRYNELCRRILDFPPELFADTPVPLARLIRYNAERGEYGDVDVEAYVEHAIALARQHVPHCFERSRPDGTVLEVRGTPLPDGGFVTSYTDITERKQAQERIQYLAHHDTLTGLPNRLLLRDRFNGAIDHLRRWGGVVAFMFLDLDYFKRINDSLGHRVGDELLVAVVRRLRAMLRESDTLSRQGGDEFILILRNIDGPDAAAKVAEKIIDSIAEPFQIGAHVLNTSASIGIAMAPRDGDDFDLLMQKADTAMYASKEHARGTFSFFHPAMDELARRRLDLANRMRHALGSDEFALAYQPQVFADTGRVFGAEALLRWHPGGGSPVPPVEFIPIAEENGLILQLGEWVIAEAARQAARWRSQGLNCRVAVNVSGVQIYRSDLVATVRRAAQEAGIDPACIQVELTESILIEDSMLMQEVIEGLKAIGASVAIDDFGTGYSSLAYLKRFRVDKLKIDRGFVTDCCVNDEGAAMTRAVISIANSLNMTAIAEGVEDHDQLAFIRRAGCNEVQGNIFSHPLRSADFFRYATARSR